MSKIVQLALIHAQQTMKKDENSAWNVTFINGETRHGTITFISEGHYLLNSSVPYYFSAEKVVYLSPA